MCRQMTAINWQFSVCLCIYWVTGVARYTYICPWPSKRRAGSRKKHTGHVQPQCLYTQWNPSKADTIETKNFVCCREMSLAQGLVVDNAPPTIAASYDKALLWTTKKRPYWWEICQLTAFKLEFEIYLGFTVATGRLKLTDFNGGCG